MEKNRFYNDREAGMTAHEPEKKKPFNAPWFGAGIAIGVAIGAAMGNLAIGVGVGVALGAGMAVAIKEKPSGGDKD